MKLCKICGILIKKHGNFCGPCRETWGEKMLFAYKDVYPVDPEMYRKQLKGSIMGEDYASVVL